MASTLSPLRSRFLADYGMIFVLLLLALFFSAVTVSWQFVEGATGAELAAREAAQLGVGDGNIVVVTGHGRRDEEFAKAIDGELARVQLKPREVTRGDPRAARLALEKLDKAGEKVAVIIATPTASRWAVVEELAGKFPSVGSPKIVSPQPYRWPNFLKADNLRNIANQIAVIAILAVGMTLVIITGGIDLSVGSLIALSAVVSTLLIRTYAGAEEATAPGMILCCLGGIALCALVGLFSGTMVTLFKVPSFIATLAVMLMASGSAYLVSKGQSIHQIPAGFLWLGRGADLFGLPNAVVLMVLLYLAAHVLMTRLTLGRYIYAVGGNPEAARLSGVPVQRVQLLVYALCGGLAGLGGVVLASQFQSGSPTYGLMYELTVIAAVVVGGTSLSGGEGKVLGTLIGAFIIAVIQNGMNLTGVESYTQMVVLGAVILGAVLLDRVKKLWQPA